MTLKWTSHVTAENRLTACNSERPKGPKEGKNIYTEKGKAKANKRKVKMHNIK